MRTFIALRKLTIAALAAAVVIALVLWVLTNPATVPGSPNQPSMTLEDPEIDRKLNICRGC